MMIYKVTKKYILKNSFIFVFPILLTIITISENRAISDKELVGLISFWLVCFLILLALLQFKIEVGRNYIKINFLIFCIGQIDSKNIISIEYGNLLRGGIGFGKGLKIWFRDKNNIKKYKSIGEKMYGQEAVAHMQKVLCQES